MKRALPLLTAAVLLAALASCSAGADNATVPPAAEQGFPGNTSTAGAASSGGSRGVADRPGPRVTEMAASHTQSRPTGEATVGEARARIVAGPRGVPGQSGHSDYICKVIGAPTVSLSSAEGTMSGSGVALAVDAFESGTTVLELAAGENNLATYCTDPGGVGPNFTGTSATFVVTEGGSTDVDITAVPRP
jgi:hypothetical protein